MTPADFHAQYMGWGKDVDGVAGIQCVDLAKEMFRIAGVPNWTAPIGGDGYADYIWYSRVRWAKWFDFVEKGGFQDGDMVLFPHKKRGGKTHPSSHVCFYFNGKQFGTNQGGNRHACDKPCNWSDALGALRWKGWEVEKMELKDGLNTVAHAGATFKIVKAADCEMLMLSSETTANIVKIGLPNREVVAAINCNYFNLQSGEHYGVEQSDVFDSAPKNPGYWAYAQKTDGSIESVRADQYWLAKKDVFFGCTPYAVRIHDGKLVYDRSTAFGDKDDMKNSQSAAMLVNGKWCLVATAKGSTCCPRDVASLAQACGATECIVLDSGGSTQLTYQGVGVVYTGRKIPNVLALVKKAQNQPEIKPQDDEKSKDAEIIAELTKRAETAEKTAKLQGAKVERVKAALLELMKIFDEEKEEEKNV